ncbi:MAG: YdbL family protein [Proteobacteria bacterium]|nr:YdbL family protein [Pseudomonadota bacterium]
MRRVRLAAWLLLLILLPLAPVWAGPLEDAKASGQIGERSDGYLGIRGKEAPPDIRALVADINAKRALEYEKVAKRNAIDIEEVGVVAGRKLIRRAKPGEWVRSPKGKWVQIE